MDELQIIDTIGSIGSQFIFLWLFLRERTRSSELSDKIHKVQRECMDRITNRPLGD